ncbi:hypothetical protein K491DRAFT_711399 [Lophiostoma macrostomum CBS 122681]|uniref:DUF1254-domain-containing protein n=1 Tax=Lophiostoma macrostomum CBS 122681 TaxID=1314788 RepID=A0A6A6TLV3_9PLEO|nr:hypothetical protein K491DRAFT_711399 [Lophiostoma macrostomum CBS 122681]
MLRCSLALLSLVIAASTHPTVRACGPPGYENVDTTCSSTVCKQNALNFAYTYGFPIYSYGSLTKSISVDTNELAHARYLQGADQDNIVRPNADTLYSTMFVDLSQNDLEITVPDFGDRFGDFPFYDLYGNNFANIGSVVVNDLTGTILVRYDKDRIGLSNSTKPEYAAIVGSPTPYGILLVRIATSNTTADLDEVHQLQDQITITPIPRSNSTNIPAFDLTIFNRTGYIVSNETSLPEAVLRLTAAFASYNVPEVSKDRPWVAETLENAGIKDGVWTQPLGTNLTAAPIAANDSAYQLLSQPGYVDELSNGWSIYDPIFMGDFHSYYQLRWFITVWGYLAVTPEVAIYPFQLNGIEEVGADQAILFEFSGRPAIQKTGFWSLTLYGENQYFVPNNLNRFTLGDRSNLTFPDGSLVYPTDNENTTDGPFQLLLQPADVKPPANWTSNWLPGPTGGGAFTYTMRFYGAEDAMKEDGSYVYPKVTVIDNITG